jgi:small subunit ribosomal protein S10e
VPHQQGVQYLHNYLHLPLPHHTCHPAPNHPEAGRPWPKGLEGEWPARLKDGKLTETPTDIGLCPLVLTRKLRLRLGTTTEFQFRGGFGHGCSLWPQ